MYSSYEQCVRSHAIFLQQETEHGALYLKCDEDMTRDFGEDSFGSEEFENDLYEYEVSDDSYDCGKYDADYYGSCGSEWTLEDSWDALTDGMYGDIPNSPWEYDAMMDAMGL